MIFQTFSSAPIIKSLLRSSVETWKIRKTRRLERETGDVRLDNNNEREGSKLKSFGSKSNPG